MTWTYHQRHHQFTRNDEVVSARAHSGVGEHMNKSHAENRKDKGPIPRGRYEIVRMYNDPKGLGQDVIELRPDPHNIMHGRSGFSIHGADNDQSGDASKGRIVANHGTRVAIFHSNDRELVVVE